MYSDDINYTHIIVMILTLHTLYRNYIDFTHNLEMIMALHTQNIVIIMTIIQNV